MIEFVTPLCDVIGVSKSPITHPINTPYQHTHIYTYIPYHHTLVTCSLNISSKHTRTHTHIHPLTGNTSGLGLSASYPINTHYHHTLSTHPLNTPSKHTHSLTGNTSRLGLSAYDEAKGADYMDAIIMGSGIGGSSSAITGLDASF